MQLVECSAMNGLQKLQQKLKNRDFFMIQKAVSQALTAFFMLKKSLKNFSSCDFPLATAIFCPPISFLAPRVFSSPLSFFLAPAIFVSLNDNVNVNDNDNDLFLFGKKKQKARA